LEKNNTDYLKSRVVPSATSPSSEELSSPRVSAVGGSLPVSGYEPISSLSSQTFPGEDYSLSLEELALTPDLPVKTGDNLDDTNRPDFSRLSLLHHHFDLMQEFLNTQGRIASAVFDESGQGGNLLPPAFCPLPSQDIPVVAQSNGASSWLDTWPLLGQILEQDEHHLYCERRFTLEEDIFLEDHTIGGSLSQRHPNLIPLAVIPFTMSMEIIAEAACCLVGGRQRVIEMEDLRGYRWLALDQEELSLGIDAQLVPEVETGLSRVKVRLFQINALNSVGQSLVFEGIVKLADGFPDAPVPLPFHLEQPRTSRWSDEQLYTSGMFHGPRFQGVKHISCWGDEGIEADLRVISIDNFFHSLHHPQFQIDAGLLDAAGQLVAYWISEGSNMDFHAFPFHVTKFHQYQKPLPPGSQILCRGIMGFINSQQIIADFDLLNESGVVIARLEGWQDRFFNIPAHYCQCRRFPATSHLSQSWQKAEISSVSRYISPFPEGFFEESGNILQRILAHLMLGEQERRFWYDLPAGQRTDWLLQAIVVKDVLREWAQQHLQLNLAPVDVQVLSILANKLEIFCPELEALTSLPEISLHKDQGIISASIQNKK
jgi:hypothetical protein